MSIHIITCGTQSPLGTWTSMSAANVRAGLARISAHPKYEDSQWSPVKVAMADFLDPEIPNLYRFLTLGMDALEETLTPLKKMDVITSPIPILIGVPGKRDGLHEKLHSKLNERLEKVAKEHQVIFQAEFFSLDHTAGLTALKEASYRLENGDVEFCIAGGIESYISLKTLAWLEEKGELKCSDNKWGMVPGEAAGFCLLTSRETAQKYGLESSAELLAVADAQENTGDGEVCLGKGLSQVFKSVVSALDEGETVNQVYCDMNGQRHRADEYGYSVLRLNQYFDAPQDLIAPANLWGDLGAASAPLLCGLIMESARKGYAKGPNNLIFTSSSSGNRAAALIKLNGI